MVAAQAADQSQLTGVAHVALRVSDVGAEVQFFNKLGFEQAFTHEQNGRTAFVFVKINDAEFLEIHPHTPVTGTTPQPLGFNHICFVTTNAVAAHAQWTKAGLNPTAVGKGPDDTLEFGAKDPSGAMTEALEILPDSQPGLDKGKHLGANRVSDWLMGIDVPAASVAAWRQFYEAIGFVGVDRGATVQMSSPATPNLRVTFHPIGKDDQTRIVFSVKSVRKAAEQLKAAGLKVEATDRELILHDPDGNTFVLQQEDARN